MRWRVVEEECVFVCASTVLRGNRFAGWRDSVHVSERAVGAVFIRDVRCCLRCGAHVIAAVRPSPRKRKVPLSPSVL